MITVTMTINGNIVGPVDVDESVKMIDFYMNIKG